MRQIGLNVGALAFTGINWLLVALCMAPLVAVGVIACFPDQGSLSHLAATTLPRYITNSAYLFVGVGGLAMLIGTCTAWLVSMYQFPGRRVLQWLLLMPLAVPSYVLAMVYGHLLDVAGPVQMSLREMTGLAFGEYWFPTIRSTGGAVLVLAFALYPYVYMLARIAFASQCASLFESAHLLGMGHRRWFWHIAVPVARPALMAGAALVVMEALADYGTVALFGVESFTTGIYRAWYGMGDPVAAAKLACWLLGFVLFAIIAERYSRRHLRYHTQGMQPRKMTRLVPRRMSGWLICLLCLIPCAVGFVVPVLVLVGWSLHEVSYWQDHLHWNALKHSLMIAGACAVVAVMIAMSFAYAIRLRLLPALWVQLATLGYAIPGSVIAVGVFVPLLLLDKSVAHWIETSQGVRPPLLLTGSIAAIVIACSIRFLAVAYGGMESALQQIAVATDDSARLLGARYGRIVRLLHVPHIKVGVMFAGFMVFTDTVKELPATLLLRPFNVDTLAIRTFELAGDGRLVQASVPALFLIGISLLAVLWLSTHSLKAQDIH